MKVHGRLLDRLVLVLIMMLAVQLGWSDLSYAAPDKEGTLSEPVTVSNVDALLAGLSDEQVRQLLLEELKNEAESAAASGPEGNGPVALLGGFLTTVDSETDGTSGRLLSLGQHVPQVLPEVKNVLAPLFDHGEWVKIVVLLGILLAGYGIELVTRSFFCPKQLQADVSSLSGQAGVAKFWSATANILPRLIGLVVFLCGSFVLFF